jgi:hypothetical protein
MLKKITRGALIGIIIIIIALLIFLPTILKKYIETNDEKLIGRQVSIDKIGINYFNGGITIKDFKFFEKDGQTVFLGFEKLYTRISIMDLFKSKYTIKKLELTRPFTSIILFDGKFNFDDLMTTETDSTKTEAIDTAYSKEVIWAVNNIKITEGSLSYSDQMFGTTLEIEKLNISSPGIAWDSDTLKSDINFGMKSGGNAIIALLLDLNRNELHTTIELNKLNIEPLTAPLKDFIRISSLEGELTNHLDIFMNLNETTDLALKGEFDLDNFSMTDDKNENIFTLKNLSIGIDSINIKNDLYRLKSININDPFILVEMFDDGDNWSRLIPDNGSDSLASDTISGLGEYDTYNVFALMAYYIRDIARTYVATDYQFDSLNVNRGMFQYNDYTLDETFSYTITEMNIRSRHIDSHADTIRFYMSVLLNGESKGIAQIMVDPQNFNNMTVNYDFYGTNLAALTPYSVYYVSYPISKAILNYSSRTTIHDGNLISTNHINIVGFKFGTKTRSMTALDVPVKLAVAILKDVHGNIDLEIPVEGSLNDPEFKLGKVIWRILKNLIVKVASAPFRLLASAFGSSEDELKEVQFNYLETDIGKYQLKSLEPLSRVLNQKEELNFQFIQLVDTLKEIDFYTTTEARKIYYARNIRKTEIDNIVFDQETLDEVNAISVKDSLFINWIDETMHFENKYLPVQKKCGFMIGESRAKEAVLALIALRQENILNYFVVENGIVPERITFGAPADLANTESGSAGYTIDRPRFIVQINVD